MAFPAPLAIRQIREIDVPNGSHAGTGAKIGAGVGGGLMLLGVAACQGSICQPTAGEAVGAVVAWVIIGSAVGALLGSGSPRWKTIYTVY